MCVPRSVDRLRANKDRQTCQASPRRLTPEPAEARPLPSRIPWAELLLRVFREDVLSCPCGGRRTVLAFITEKKAVQAILEHLGLPTTGPPITPLRGGADRRALLRVSCLPRTGGRKIAYQPRRRPKRRGVNPFRPALPRAATNCSWRCPVKGAASALRAPPAGCTTPRPTSWIG